MPWQPADISAVCNSIQTAGPFEWPLVSKKGHFFFTLSNTTTCSWPFFLALLQCHHLAFLLLFWRSKNQFLLQQRHPHLCLELLHWCNDLQQVSACVCADSLSGYNVSVRNHSAAQFFLKISSSYQFKDMPRERAMPSWPFTLSLFTLVKKKNGPVFVLHCGRARAHAVADSIFFSR